MSECAYMQVRSEIAHPEPLLSERHDRDVHLVHVLLTRLTLDAVGCIRAGATEWEYPP